MIQRRALRHTKAAARISPAIPVRRV